jgi:hypothetical protein
MRAIVERPAIIGLLVWSQTLVVAAYLYAGVAYLATDATFFPEQAPPPWSWPAVVVVAVGFVPASLAILLSYSALTSPRVRSERPRWRALFITTTATVLMLLLMASPVGWRLFDWYVS